MREVFKVTELDSSKIVRSMFENQRSYEYFLRAIELAKKIQVLKDSKAMIFVGNTLLTDNESISVLFYDGLMPTLGTYNDGCMIMWLGSTMGNIEDTMFVYKKELDIFKTIKYVQAKDIHTMTL